MSSVQNRLSEAKLLELLKNKKKEGFDYLYDNYSAALMGTALRIMGDRSEAEEVVHDSFLKIWNGIDGYDSDKGRLFTWMARICKNTSLDRLKSARIKREYKTDSIQNVVSATESQHRTSMNVDTIGVKEWIDDLDEGQRQVIQTLYFQGMSHSQAAEVLDIPLGTVKTRLRAGLKVIRKKLGIN